MRFTMFVIYDSQWVMLDQKPFMDLKIGREWAETQVKEIEANGVKATVLENEFVIED